MTRQRNGRGPTEFLKWLMVGFLLLTVPGAAHGQSFTRITAGAVATDLGNTTGASWVDFDGDGDDDLYVCNRGNTNALHRNDGGTLTRLNVPGLTTVGSIGSSWADYDNDGDLDACLAGEPAFLFRNDGGTFTDVTARLGATSPVSGWGAAWSDYDRDGYVDLLITFPANGIVAPNAPNALFHNRGDGFFDPVVTGPIVTGLAPYTVGTWADHDDDGDPDLSIGAGPANGTRATDYLYRNRLAESGVATFERITTSPIATDLVDGQVWNWIDYDNDGDLDAFLTNWSGGFPGGMPDFLYRNDHGAFTRITTGTLVTNTGFSLSQLWEDFDNDGDMDVFVTNADQSQTNRYYRNNGNGTFTRQFSAITNDFGASWAACAADHDDDGDIDVFVGNAVNQAPGGPDFFYRNDTVNGAHWLGVRLKGHASNASAIGATVRVKATINGTPRWQRRDVSAQNTFCGQGSLKLHFGLGNATIVDSLEVRWPSGLRETLVNLPVDDCREIEEGATTPVPVDLLHFSAERTPQGVRVRWAIATMPGDGARITLHREIPGDGRRPVGLPIVGAGEADVLDREAPAGRVDYWLEEITRRGAQRWHGPLHLDDGVVAGAEARLSPPSPNPFHATTSLRFTVPRSGPVTLRIHDVTGRVVRTLREGAIEAGTLEVEWDGLDASGRTVSPGVYFCRFTAGAETGSRKLLRIGAP